MKLRQNEAEALRVLWLDTGLRALKEESLQPFMLEASDHGRSVTLSVTHGKTPNTPRQQRAAVVANNRAMVHARPAAVEGWASLDGHFDISTRPTATHGTDDAWQRALNARASLR